MSNSNVSDYELIVPPKDKAHKIFPSVKHLHPVVQLSTQHFQVVLTELLFNKTGKQFYLFSL